MKKVYEIPELDITKFEVNKAILEQPTETKDAVHIGGDEESIAWGGSDPDETIEDIEW